MTSKKYIEEILFVDDSDDEAFITRLILKKEDVELEIRHCVNYNSLRSHIEAEKDNRPMLALVDLNMPLQNGIEVIEQLYSEYSKSTIIAGVFSGSEDPKDKQDAMNSGAAFFINKPMDSQFLTELCSLVPIFELEQTSDGSKKLLING